MKKVLALATCFNRIEKTKASVMALSSSNKNIELDFIIVDDNSTDGTYEALSKIDNVNVIKGSGNLFYSGGMRVAIDNALKTDNNYDYCLLFNDDVEFFDKAIENMAASIDDYILVGATCDNDNKLSYGGVIKTSTLRPSTMIIDSSNPKSDDCDTFNANCVLIPWDIFKALGNMDSAYTHSMGDFDYGFKAKRMGYKIKVYDEFIGVCCDNPVENTWRNPELDRKKRLKLKEQPKGLPVKEWFHYLNKNYNLLTAVAYTIIPYIKIIIKK